MYDISEQLCLALFDKMSFCSRKRPDTVRKIINYITSEKREQLSEQLGTRSGTIIDEDEFRGTNDEFLAEGLDTAGWEDWMPDPPDAPSGSL